MFKAKQTVTMLPVKDIDRARGFYEEKLGFKELERHPDGGVVCSGPGAGAIDLMKRPEQAGENRTLMSFEVENLEDAIQDLESRGVNFEDYDEPEFKTEHHIAQFNGTKAAWFRDSEGNYLCLHQAAS